MHEGGPAGDSVLVVKRAKSAWGVGFVKATARIDNCAAKRGRVSGSVMPRKTRANKKIAPAAADMSTGEATVATLLAHGLDTVYALPGVHNDHLFDAFQRAGERLRVVHTRHEQGAAYMALGAALATSKPQTYVVVPGPGLLNSGAALLTAYGMNAPVLAIIGQIPACRHRPRPRPIARNPRPGRHHRTAGRSFRAIRWARRSAGESRPGDRVYAARSPRPGRARMRHRRLGQARPRCARAAAAGARAEDRRGRRAQGRQAPRQGQAHPHRRRRRRAGRLARSDATLRHAAGARARLPARPRRARRPQPFQRHAAARPRIVGRGRCGARRRHSAAQPDGGIGAWTRNCRSCASMPTARSPRGSTSRKSR